MNDESVQYLIRTRSQLHSIAELSAKEYKTSAFIQSELKRFGLKYKTIDTGVVCDIGKHPRIAFRADFDALPLTERTNRADAPNDGVMHACGHDGHAANLLNVARILAKEKVNVRLIFQFGEEDCGGAQQMIDAGAINGIDEIYALHLNPDIPVGKIGTTYGAMFAGCCEADVDFAGYGAHCACPEKGANASHAMIEFCTQAIRVAEQIGLLFNCGVLSAGTARNVIADKAHAEFTSRYFDMDKCEAFMMEVERILLATDEKYGTNHNLKLSCMYAPLINSALAVDKVKSLCDNTVDTDAYYTAEDFSAYLEKIDGCMVWLGVRDDTHVSPLHSDTFDFDERALLYGTELFLKLARTEGK